MDASLLVQTLPLLSVGSSIGIVSAALALGIRHGIDWDHIAAITDITSTTASAHDPAVEEGWLTGEVGVMLTDETHHAIGQEHGHDEEVSAPVPVSVGASAAGLGSHPPVAEPH